MTENTENKYCNLIGENKIRDEYTKINEGFKNVEEDINTHNHDEHHYTKDEIDNMIGAKRTARFTIGTTQSGWTAGDVDYLCTGSDDQVQINNALNALPAGGGEVVILDGTYNIEGAIHVAKDNTTLRGNGNATVLKRMYNSASTDTGATARGLITLDNKKGCRIKNLYIDGNKNDYDSSNNYGMRILSSSNNVIKGNICNNTNSDGIRLANFSNSNIIADNICNNNTNGIRLNNSDDNIITNNICNNNAFIDLHFLNTTNDNIVANNKGNTEDLGNNIYYYTKDEIDNMIGTKRTARFTIGTTQAGWTAKDVDYLCTGNNDQIQINDALNALPAGGGEVVILDGTYNIEGAIHVAKDNTTLRGNGNATVLKRMYNSDNINEGNTARGLITLNSKNGCRIQGLQIDGNKATYTSTYNCGIRILSSSDNTITGNTCSGNSKYGIYLTSSSDNNTITSNTWNNNDEGIRLVNSSSNTITGNTWNNNSKYGIYLTSSSDNNTITSNTCNNNDEGIYLSSTCSYNCIVGNVLVDNGTAYQSDEGTENIEANNVKK